MFFEWVATGDFLRFKKELKGEPIVEIMAAQQNTQWNPRIPKKSMKTPNPAIEVGLGPCGEMRPALSLRF